MQLVDFIGISSGFDGGRIAGGAVTGILNVIYTVGPGTQSGVTT